MGVRERLPGGAVGRYYAYMATSSVGLSIPIWVVFLRANGLSYTEIMVLDGIWWVGLVAGEIPTGWVGDRIGWRNSLVLGNVLRAISVVAMGLSNTFVALALVYLLWAVGSTLQSGSSDAWLYELLERRTGSEAFSHVKGRGEALSMAVGGVGAIVGGYLGGIDLRYPFFATGGLWVLGVVVLLSLPRIEVSAEDRITVFEALPTVRDRLTRPSVLRVVLWAGVLFGVLQAVARLTQPVSVSLGVSVANLGWLYAGFTFTAAISSDRSGWLRDRLGLGRWLALAPLGVGILFAGTLVIPLVAFPAFFAVRGVRATTRPLVNHYLNDRIETAGRATVLSAASMVFAAVNVPFSVVVGGLADLATPIRAMGIVGVALVVAALARPLLDPGTLTADASIEGDERNDTPRNTRETANKSE